VKRLTTVIVLFALAAIATPAGAATGPALSVKTTWGDTNLQPGGQHEFVLHLRNAGDAPPNAPVTIEDKFPAGVSITNIDWHSWWRDGALAPNLGFKFCSGLGTSTLTCTLPADEAEEFLPPLGNRGINGPVTAGLTPTNFAPPLYVDVLVDKKAKGATTNTATVSGGGSASFSDEDPITISSAASKFGLVPGSFEADLYRSVFPFGPPERQAGTHPFELRVNFDITEQTGFYVCPESCFGFAVDNRYISPTGSIRTADVTLPRGFIGNPEATPKCDPVDFAAPGASNNSTSCPANTQVGYLNVWFSHSGNEGHGESGFIFTNGALLAPVPVYNLEPPPGVPADFAFNAGNLVQGHIYPNIDPSQNYAIKTLTPNISTLVRVRGSEVTFWGVPGDPAHDKYRFFPSDQAGPPNNDIAAGAPFEGASIRPLLTAPADCGFDNGGARIRVDSYGDTGHFTPLEESSPPLNVTGCDDLRFRFEPDVALQPTTRDAGASTGLAVHLEVPQRSDEVVDAEELYAQNGDVQGISTPPLKKAVVTFPEGMTVNPAAAQGLVSCSPEQIGLGTDRPVSCPDASQYGTLTLHTPILPIDAQPEGWVYIAKQNDNPFHNFLSLYLVIQEPERGILIKVPGRVDLDPRTGQITTTFDDLPQFPMSDMEMHLKGGLRAGLVNPKTCGTKTIEATFYSWHDPQTPHTVTSSYDVTKNPDGSPCLNSLGDRPFDPQLSGGTVNNRAGSFSPLEIRLTRSDEDQELSGVEGTAPPGLLASLKGIGRCSDAAIAAAAVEGRTGAEENANPSCPASSLVGSVDAGTGVGQVLTYVEGKIYLAGPYKGAPVSGVAIVPAVAGPFDLGVIVTRAPAFVDPKTAQVSLKTDPLPLIFKGVPVRVRDIQVHMDRDRFTLNPTSCEPFSLTGMLFSSEGKSKLGESRFQAADCASLGFKPRLTTRLFGGTKRGAHPKFRGIYRARPGDANAASAVVTLPRSEFLDQAHIRTVCTRVQFAADQCPAGSIYGHAQATTPLLDETLSGPVYLRSSDHKLPDLVAVLHGIIDVEVVGRIDSIRGGIRANFESIPDAPVDTFTISMQGGKKGLLVNSRDICAHAYRIEADFSAQSGKEATLTPKLQAKCGKAGRKAKRR
jgi:hypothetical protein